MIRDVENDDAGARLLVQERNPETFQDRRVQRQKSGKAGVVASAHKVQPFVDDREGETRANFQRRHDCYLGWRLQFSVCKETMWDVERQRAVLIQSNDESRKIAEEIVRRVEAAAGPGPHIRNIPIKKARAIVKCERLKLMVIRLTATLEN